MPKKMSLSDRGRAMIVALAEGAQKKIKKRGEIDNLLDEQKTISLSELAGWDLALLEAFSDKLTGVIGGSSSLLWTRWFVARVYALQSANTGRIVTKRESLSWLNSSGDTDELARIGATLAELELEMEANG